MLHSSEQLKKGKFGDTVNDTRNLLCSRRLKKKAQLLGTVPLDIWTASTLEVFKHQNVFLFSNVVQLGKDD